MLDEWLGRGGNAPFRVVSTLNGILQPLLQARLQIEARGRGDASQNLFPKDMRPGLGSIPDFKRPKFEALARSVDLDRLHRAIGELNDLQRAFFPTGDELVVPDAGEMAERLLIGLLAPAGR